MNIKNQRNIFSLAKEGSVKKITPHAITFGYGSMKDQRIESKALVEAGYYVISSINEVTVMD